MFFRDMMNVEFDWLGDEYGCLAQLVERRPYKA